MVFSWANSICGNMCITCTYIQCILDSKGVSGGEFVRWTWTKSIFSQVNELFQKKEFYLKRESFQKREIPLKVPSKNFFAKEGIFSEFRPFQKREFFRRERECSLRKMFFLRRYSLRKKFYMKVSKTKLRTFLGCHVGLWRKNSFQQREIPLKRKFSLKKNSSKERMNSLRIETFSKKRVLSENFFFSKEILSEKFF